MVLDEFIDDAYQYVSAGNHIRRLLIGGVTVVCSVSVIPLFMLIGYYVQVVSASIDRSSTPPNFVRPITYIRQGAGGFIIWFVYVGIFVGLPLVVTSVLALTVFAGVGISIERAAIVLVINSTVGLLAALYLFPMAIIRYVHTESVKESVNLFRAFDCTLNIPYSTELYVISIAQLGGIVFGVYAIAELIGLAGYLLLPFLLFVHGLVVAHWYGTIASGEVLTQTNQISSTNC